MVDRLRDFVVPYQHALGTEASQLNVHLYLVESFSFHVASPDAAVVLSA